MTTTTPREGGKGQNFHRQTFIFSSLSLLFAFNALRRSRLSEAPTVDIKSLKLFEISEGELFFGPKMPERF